MSLTTQKFQSGIYPAIAMRFKFNVIDHPAPPFRDEFFDALYLVGDLFFPCSECIKCLRAAYATAMDGLG